VSGYLMGHAHGSGDGGCHVRHHPLAVAAIVTQLVTQSGYVRPAVRDDQAELPTRKAAGQP